MKKYSVIFLLLLCNTAIFISCKSTKSIQQSSKSTEISVPFSDNKYNSDKNAFRAVQSGNSPDLATSKKVAIQNAKTLLAGNIQTTIKAVTDNYINQRNMTNSVDFESKFEELSRQVTKQELNNVKIIDEKVFKETNNTYTTWVAIEMSKEDISNQLMNGVTNDKKLQIDFDKYKYEKIFNEEMDKFQKD